jgi:tetratricopeptide (TPR) repeat protein
MMLHSALEKLESADLVRRVSAASERAYVFKHGLVQETAYDSLLNRDRKRLHGFVAQTLERAFAPIPEDLVLILAAHWQEAGDAARALSYFLAAGKRAARVYAHTEALSALEQARALRESVALDAATLRELYQQRGRVLELRGEYEAALANYVELEELARARGDAALELQAIIRQVILFATPNTLTNLPRAIEYAQRALDYARALNDRPAEAQVLWTLLLAEHFSGNTARAVKYGEQSLAIARALDLREQMAYTLNDLVRPYAQLQRLAEAQQANQEAQALWRELGNLPMLADSLTNAGMGAFFTGEYQSGFPMVEQALALSQKTSNVWGQAFAQEVLGMMYYPLGEWEKALTYLHAAARLGRQVNFVDPDFTGLTFAALIYRALAVPKTASALMEKIVAAPAPSPAWYSGPLAMLAILYAECGELERAQALLEQAQRVFEGVTDSPAPFILAFAEIVVRLAQGESDAAYAVSTNLLPFVEQAGIKPYRSLALFLHARVLEQQGQRQLARETYARAYAEANLVQTRAVQWEIAAALVRVETQLGNPAQADVWRARGRAAVQFIADHAPPELHESFLNRPEVRAVMDSGA